MAIPQAQLDTWSRQGSVAGSSATYQSIRNALTVSSSPIAGLISSGTVKIYLQGSYAHDTNTKGDSDVDVLVELVTTFNYNKEELSPEQDQAHQQAFDVADYQWADLRRDVITALENYYGGAFVDTTGNKALKVLPNSGRLKADVVPVTTFRKYDYFYGQDESSHSKEEGVVLYHTQTGKEIINYPEHHYNNAVAKHGATNQEYKGLVRTMKNMRSHLIDKELIEASTAPSYFLQNLIYNIPNHLFEGNLSNTVPNALNFLYQADLDEFWSQNEQHMLFGNTEEQWNTEDAKKIIDAYIHLWNNWPLR